MESDLRARESIKAEVGVKLSFVAEGDWCRHVCLCAYLSEVKPHETLRQNYVKHFICILCLVDLNK